MRLIKKWEPLCLHFTKRSAISNQNNTKRSLHGGLGFSIPMTPSNVNSCSTGDFNGNNYTLDTPLHSCDFYHFMNESPSTEITPSFPSKLQEATPQTSTPLTDHRHISASRFIYQVKWTPDVRMRTTPILSWHILWATR